MIFHSDASSDRDPARSERRGMAAAIACCFQC